MLGTWIDIKSEQCLMIQTSSWLRRNLQWQSIEMLTYNFLKSRLKKLHRLVSLFKALNRDSMKSLISKNRRLTRFQILEDFLKSFNRLLRSKIQRFENLNEVISNNYRFCDKTMLRIDCKDLKGNKFQVFKGAKTKTLRID